MLSINRGFSAPVIVTVERGAGELERLAICDTDPFARYEAMQELMMRDLLDAIGGGSPSLQPLTSAIGSTLISNLLDPAFKAECIILPKESYIAERMERIDPDAIHRVREEFRASIGRSLQSQFEATYAASTADPTSLAPLDKGLRRLRAATLGWCAGADPQRGAELAKRQFDDAQTMTERQSALATLSLLGGAQWDSALEGFYERFKGDPLVIDKWFAVQAGAPRSDTVEAVEELIRHPDFTLANPNRLRSVIGSFGASPFAFHRADGAGYRLLGRMILAVDAINPQTAARFIPPLGRWRRYDEQRAAKMRSELEKILATPGLSKDVFEQASKSLA
jgi:aminopeptidase N